MDRAWDEKQDDDINTWQGMETHFMQQQAKKLTSVVQEKG